MAGTSVPRAEGLLFPQVWGLSDTEPDRDITHLPPRVRACVRVCCYAVGMCFHEVVGALVNICDHVCVSSHQVRARTCAYGVHAFPLGRGAYVCDHGWRVMNEDACHRPVRTEFGVMLPTADGPKPQRPQGLGRGSCPPPLTPGGWNQGPLGNRTSTRPRLYLSHTSPPPALSQVCALPPAGRGPPAASTRLPSLLPQENRVPGQPLWPPTV